MGGEANCSAAVGQLAEDTRSTQSDLLLQLLVVMTTACCACLVATLYQLHQIRQSDKEKGEAPAAEGPGKAAAAPAETAPPAETAGGCPFGYDKPKPKLTTAQKQALRMQRVTNLYEDYVHLHDLSVVWANPVTDNPQMEPLFSAAMHGIELSFVLMAEFIKDSRRYVVKRPRVELVAEDVMVQCDILAQIVDGELEDEACVGADQTRRTLMQDFPFEGAPPTLSGNEIGCGRQSPGLDMLVDAVSRSFPVMSVPERHSIIKVIKNVTGKIDTSFATWSVGIGWEAQLRQLRQSVGLAPIERAPKREHLDYAVLVRPAVVANTLLRESYSHSEDFFFRSVHLGTECWAFIALDRLRSAKRQVEEHGHWQNAAAHVRIAAHILEYLGEHVMMLTSMVLRDYLHLKVEIEGTSGEGSSAVKSFRPLIESLFVPLASALLEGQQVADDAALRVELLELYEHPERQPGLYNYAKSLERVESSLLGGFYFRHFCLASNVIGSTAKGTMKKSVAALKKTYEKVLFPSLDITRAALGSKLDAELVQFKGRIMDKIERQRNSPSPEPANACKSSPSTPMSTPEKVAPPLDLADSSEPKPPSLELVPREHRQEEGERSARGRKSSPSSPTQQRSDDIVRRALYSTHAVPRTLAEAAAAESAGMPDLSFLDHAWGKTPPSAHVAATKRLYGLYALGNTCWDILFGEIMPEAASHVKRLLGVGEKHVVEFGHNSHELVTRLLSTKLDRCLKEGSERAKLRILTTDTEFYSLTRQLNRLSELGPSSLIQIDSVVIEPLATFPERFAAAAGEAAYDMVYSSQTVYSTQETIVPDVPGFATAVWRGVQAGWAAHRPGLSCDALLALDGYHGFGAIPTCLGHVDEAIPLCYISGMLKHVGSGANAAFLVAPTHVPLRPLLTGWLADPSVLAPDSDGLKLGSAVGYAPGLSLMGGTPAFAPSLLVFNEVMRRWVERGITVERVHGHVMRLHERFLDGLKDRAESASDAGSNAAGSGGIRLSSLHSLLPASCRSHTLVFDQPSAEAAKAVVNVLRKSHGIEIDSRKTFVRVGFGYSHHAEEVDRLLRAVGCFSTSAQT